jgi:hypothetical protein
MGFGALLSTLASVSGGDASSTPLVTVIIVVFLLVMSIVIGLLIAYIAAGTRR